MQPFVWLPPSAPTQAQVSQVLAFSTVSAKQCNEAKNIHPVVRRDTGYQSASPGQSCTNESWGERPSSLVFAPPQTWGQGMSRRARGMLGAHTWPDIRFGGWGRSEEGRREGKRRKQKGAKEKRSCEQSAGSRWAGLLKDRPSLNCIPSIFYRINKEYHTFRITFQLWHQSGRITLWKATENQHRHCVALTWVPKSHSYTPWASF